MQRAVVATSLRLRVIELAGLDPFSESLADLIDQADVIGVTAGSGLK